MHAYAFDLKLKLVSCPELNPLGLPERLREIRDQIRRVLDADREPERRVGDAEGGALARVQGAMRRARRVRDQRARLADVDEVREKVDAGEHLLRGLGRLER